MKNNNQPFSTWLRNASPLKKRNENHVEKQERKATRKMILLATCAAVGLSNKW